MSISAPTPPEREARCKLLVEQACAAIAITHEAPLKKSMSALTVYAKCVRMRAYKEPRPTLEEVDHCITMLVEETTLKLQRPAIAGRPALYRIGHQRALNYLTDNS